VRKNKLITISKPLFPSYIFTYQSHPVFKIRDTYINYISIKGKPLTISQKIIDDIKKLEEEIKLGTIIAAEPTTFAPKDLVMISEGPLIGKKAIVLYSNNTIVKFKLLDSGYITKTQHKNLIKISY
jgi:transcription antitermination factor NusG